MQTVETEFHKIRCGTIPQLTPRKDEVLVKKLEFVPTGIERILEEQDITPYLQNTGVDEILRNHPDEVTHKAATLLFMLGYIEGKRAERAKRKKREAV